MKIDQIRIFLCVAKHLSMTKAGEELHLSQPAISAAIRILEDQYQIRLFDRVGRHLELTDAARALLPEADLIIHDLERAKDLLRNYGRAPSGRLHIFASQTIANHILPKYLSHFSCSYPQISLSISIGNSHQAIQCVVDGTANLGIIEGPVTEERVLSEVVGVDRLGIYAAPTHDLASSRVAVKRLAEAKWVLREQGSGTREHLISNLAVLGFSPDQIDVRLELPSNASVLEVVREGAYITAISDLAAESVMASGAIVRLPIELPSRALRLSFHKERSPSPATELFCRGLRRYLEEGFACGIEAYTNTLPLVGSSFISRLRTH